MRGWRLPGVPVALSFAVLGLGGSASVIGLVCSFSTGAAFDISGGRAVY